MPVKWRVYIDEAGDRGMSPTSSSHFVTSAVVVPDDSDLQCRKELAALHETLDRRPSEVLHFQKLSHSNRLKATQDIAGFSFGAISNVILCKSGFSEPLPDGTVPYIANPDPMYLWAMRLLLERVSWYCRDNGGGAAITTFAHVRRFKTAKLHSYLSLLRQSDTTIDTATFQSHPLRINSPDKIELLQLADIAASALFAAIEPDRFGNLEPRYFEQLIPRIYRRGARPITSYGLKVFPPEAASASGTLAWLSEL